MIKIKKIDEPKIRALEPSNMEEIKEILYKEEIAENREVYGEILEDLQYGTIKFDSCLFRNNTFLSCDFKRCDILDVIFENCDLSNINFNGGSFYRVIFRNCKLTGSKFERSNLKNVIFDNCVGIYSTFAYSKLTNVLFSNSDFKGGNFQGIRNSKFYVDKVNLSNCTFVNTPLKGIDFTSCEVSEIEIEIGDLRGGIFSQLQGIELSRLLGIIIK